MRVDERGPAHIYFITGNGVREHRILEAAAPKFDHSKIIGIPQATLRRHIRPTGLGATIRALTELVERVRVGSFLILIDREHVKGLSEVEDELKGHGFGVLDKEELTANCWRIRVRRGYKEATIYLVILGVEKAVEENLAKLIELLYLEHVKPTKEEVYRWLRRHDISDKDLVERASKRLFEQAFPQLAKALEELAGDHG